VEDDLLQSPHYRERSGSTPQAIILMFVAALTVATVTIAVRVHHQAAPQPPGPVSRQTNAPPTFDATNGGPYTLQARDTDCTPRSPHRCPSRAGAHTVLPISP
jgi:hypothetical protein